MPRAFRLRVGFPDEVTARRRSWMLAPSARRPSPSARGSRGDGQWGGGAPTAGAGCALWQADPADFGHREAITPAHLRHGRAAARRRPGEVAARRRSRIRAPPRTAHPIRPLAVAATDYERLATGQRRRKPRAPGKRSPRPNRATGAQACGQRRRPGEGAARRGCWITAQGAPSADPNLKLGAPSTGRSPPDR